jgi:hypothetical protein
MRVQFASTPISPSRYHRSPKFKLQDAVHENILLFLNCFATSTTTISD